MSDYESWQEFLRSRPDASTIILELKRRFAVRTDSELADKLEKTQSAIAHWRRKNAVPEAVLLSVGDEFDGMARLRSSLHDTALRALSVRIVAAYVQTQPDPDAIWKACQNSGVAFECIYAAVSDSVEELQRITGKDEAELIRQLFDDEKYIDRVIEWVSAADFGDWVFAGVIVKPAAILLPDLVY